ncbi:MAG: 3-hydroxyacyl-CoA dehydrogenase [Streptosporangiales bacterium]
MGIATVGVVGLGTMGAGIVQVLAAGGLSVVGVEYDQRLLDSGRDRLAKSTDRAVRRGKLAAEARDELLARVTFTTAYADLADLDLVIEAATERRDLKREIFQRLDAAVRSDAVLATNTSSLSVTDIAAATGRPEKVVGMHFFNPAPVQKLVEVVRGVQTDEAVAETVADLARRLGKAPVVVGDRAGFIANALLFGYLNRAVTMYGDGRATREDIDAAVRLGCGYPMGPLELLDLIGLDTGQEILATMYRETGSRLHAAAPLLRQLVSAGRLGRKTGRGFYSYESAGSPKVVPDALTPAEPEATESRWPGDMVRSHVPSTGADLVEVVRTVESTPETVAQAVAACTTDAKQVVVCADRAGFLVDALLLPYLCDAVRMVQDGYTSVDDVDTAMKLGCALPKGPFELLDDIGLPTVLAGEQAIYDEEREPGLVPPALLTQLVAAGRGFRALQ